MPMAPINVNAAPRPILTLPPKPQPEPTPPGIVAAHEKALNAALSPLTPEARRRLVKLLQSV